MNCRCLGIRNTSRHFWTKQIIHESLNVVQTLNFKVAVFQIIHITSYAVWGTTVALKFTVFWIKKQWINTVSTNQLKYYLRPSRLCYITSIGRCWNIFVLSEFCTCDFYIFSPLEKANKRHHCKLDAEVLEVKEFYTEMWQALGDSLRCISQFLQ